MRRAFDVEAWLVGTFAALAALAVTGTGLLLLHRTVPDWLLPACVVVGIVVVAAQRPAPGPAHPLRPWQACALGAVLLSGALMIGYGALSTPSRHWDGAAMWDLKTAALTAAPTLEQPSFREPAVYCHSRDYQLLQPLTIALLDRFGVPGRSWFVVAWLAFAAAVLAAARRAGCTGNRQLAFGCAAMLTPMLLAPTSGGFDSGYGDAWLTAAMATIAYGLSARAALPIACGCIVAVLQKPEGLPYCAALAAICWLLQERRLFLAIGGATTLAAVLGLALRLDLATFGAQANATGLALAAGTAGVVLLLVDGRLRSRPPSPRAQLLVRLATLLLLTAAAVPIVALAGVGAGDFAPHLAQRLTQLPRILAAIAASAFGERFALTFVLPVLCGIVHWRRRRPSTNRSLGLWLLASAPIACLPFLLLPLDDLEHHLRSTLPRVLLHWTGVAWICTIGSISAISAASAGTSRTAAPHPGT